MARRILLSPEDNTIPFFFLKCGYKCSDISLSSPTNSPPDYIFKMTRDLQIRKLVDIKKKKINPEYKLGNSQGANFKACMRIPGFLVV